MEINLYPMPQKKTSREEIIRKSIEVFREKGYHHTSISNLKKACGVAHAANLYYYFTNKEDLMMEALKSVQAYFDHSINSIAYQEELPAYERLRRMAEKIKKVFSSGKGGCIMANTTLENAQTDPVFLDTVRSFFDNLLKALAHVLENKYGEEEAMEKAEQVVQDIEGGLMLMQLYQDEKYLAKALNRARALLEA